MSQEEKTLRPEPIRVFVDPDLYDLIPRFLDNRRLDAGRIHAALERKDFEAVGIIGHRMKGDGGGYGLNAISEIGAVLEEAAKDRNPALIKKSVGHLLDFLERVEVGTSLG